MSLRTRIVWYLSAVVLVWASLHHIVQKVFVMRSFSQLEEADARRNVLRVRNAIEREKEELASRCKDWASSDGVYRYALDRDARFAKETFDTELLRRNGINLLYVCDMKGKVLWGRCVDGEDKPLRLADFPPDDLGGKHPLLVSGVGPIDSSVELRDTGVWLTDHGAMLVSAKPITDARGKGPVRGTVIVGRMLTGLFQDMEQNLEDLQRQTEVQFELWTANGPILETEQVSIDEIVASKEPLVRVRDETQLRAFAALDDIRGQPALVVCATLPRLVTAQGDRAVLSALISTMAAGALFLLVLLRLLQQNVLGPIAQLTEHAVEIGKNEDPTKKLDLRREDELGILAHEFDGMMEKLAQSRAALVKAARHAGMSEIATGVLHNVGNVLNSVNVSASLLAEKTRSSSVSDLRLAMGAVRESAGDLAAFLQKDPRGEHLYPLLVALSEQLDSEHSAVEQELKRLTEGLDHVKLLVQSQQSYAGHSGVLEPTVLAQQLETAVSMTGRTVGEDSVRIVREYADIPVCEVDCHRLLEILVNLLQNARQALHDPTLTERSITLRLRSTDEDRVAIDVEDTGVGIPPENLEQIFVHGFTTKKNGHGFGLHASANAATEMSGKLTAHSDGPGRGARFTLEFPIRSIATAGATP
ncbi:MAG: HAMP domain-containing protein [Planctomycetes bacterium]|nr:HAMP domain-containing protein [Planctomycetota bacterium]